MQKLLILFYEEVGKKEIDFINTFDRFRIFVVRYKTDVGTDRPDRTFLGNFPHYNNEKNEIIEVIINKPDYFSIKNENYRENVIKIYKRIEQLNESMTTEYKIEDKIIVDKASRKEYKISKTYDIPSSYKVILSGKILFIFDEDRIRKNLDGFSIEKVGHFGHYVNKFKITKLWISYANRYGRKKVSKDPSFVGGILASVGKDKYIFISYIILAIKLPHGNIVKFYCEDQSNPIIVYKSDKYYVSDGKVSMELLLEDTKDLDYDNMWKIMRPDNYDYRDVKKIKNKSFKI